MARDIEKMSPFAVPDYVLDKVGLPEVNELIDELDPKTAARRMGLPTPDDLSDQLLAEFRKDMRQFQDGKIPEPPEPEDFFERR